MKDIFTRYHKHKTLSHISLLALSAIVAVSINVAISATPQAKMLQANILEIQKPAETSSVDFTAIIRDEQIVFRNNTMIEDMKQFSFSLAYDPEVLSLGAYMSTLSPANISEIKNENGFVSYIISFENPITLSQKSEILSVNYIKLKEQTLYINPIQINFTDIAGETFLLSSERLMF